MSIRFNPPSGWPQNGRAFNHGVVQSEGKVLHITGQVAWNQEGLLIGGRDCGAQLQQCFENTRMILEHVGGRLEDVVSLTIYFLRRDDLPDIQRMRAQYFTAAQAPASILIQTPGLVSPDLLVEVVPIAVVPLERYHHPASAI